MENKEIKSRTEALPEFKNLLNKKLKLGYKKQEGSTIGLTKQDLNRALGWYILKN